MNLDYSDQVGEMIAQVEMFMKEPISGSTRHGSPI